MRQKAEQHSPGGLIMLWRQRLRQGKGSWTGPLRVLLQEASTIWAATGATIIRAKTNQVRPCSTREELANATKGMSVIRNPVNLGTLLRGYSGRHYLDATQETSGQALEEDVAPAEVRMEPAQSRRKLGRDKWEFRRDTLVRVHNTTRLTLFTLDKVQECPVKDSDFTGRRRTFVKDSGSVKQQTIEDEYCSEAKPNRGLLERWTGETHFELKSGVAPGGSSVAVPEAAASRESQPTSSSSTPGL